MSIPQICILNWHLSYISNKNANICFFQVLPFADDDDGDKLEN